MLKKENNLTTKYMLKIFFYLNLLIILACNNQSGNNNPVEFKLNIDSTFVAWNNLTYKSIIKNFNSSTDTIENELYGNRIESFKSFLNIKNIEEVNSNSIRYEFLKYIWNNIIHQDFIIVEANKLQERVEIWNFVIYIKTGKVEIFQYEDNEWVKKNLNNFNIIYRPIKWERVDFGKGINQDDTIISYFNLNGKIESEYFLFSTLSHIYPWESILDLR